LKYSFDLNVEPKPQQRPRLYGKRVYDPSKEYKSSLKVQLRSQFLWDIIDSPIFLKLVFRMPIPKTTTKARMKAILNGEIFYTKRPDIDNLAKAVLDSLNGVIIEDDSQIYGLRAEKVYSQNPGIFIEIITE
jgi:Holliday junction resolvase RusA-like endonuclease